MNIFLTRILLILILSTLIVAWFSPISWAQDLIKIHSVQWQGSGCDFHNVAATISPDSQELSLLFDQYRVLLKPQDPSIIRKDCLILIDVETAPHISFGFKFVDYRGFAFIPKNVEGFHRLGATLQGQRFVPHARDHRLIGPFQNNYFVRVEAASQRIQYSNCSQRFHRVLILSQLGINRFRWSTQSEEAFIDLDSKDFSMRQGFGIEMRMCN